MPRRKLVFIGEQPYWTNKEMPKEPTGEKIKKRFLKGAKIIGKGALSSGKAIGKKLAEGASNYQEMQRQKQMQEQKRSHAPARKKKKYVEEEPAQRGGFDPMNPFGF